MARRVQPPPPVQQREFRSVNEIDAGIAKLERRIRELEALDIAAEMRTDTGAFTTVRSNIRETIRDVFGGDSPEFREHEHLAIWHGALYVNMPEFEEAQAKEQGRTRVLGIVKGLINRLQEKRADLDAATSPAPSSYFDRLNLHPRILDVARDLFMDGHHWPAVFEASKALVNYVKERSRRNDLDGAPLMRTVFSKKDPILRFNDLKDQTDQDQQEGIMHLFEGAVLGIRNPGGHAFPEGTEQRAIEYLQLLSLLAYLVQEAKRA